MKTREVTSSRVLVTGGAGFIGSNIIEKLLRQDNRVTCLDNLSTGKMSNIEPFMNDKAFRFIKGDICDLTTCMTACEDVDIVFQEAALGSVPRSIKNPAATNRSNIDGFLNMLIAARDSKVKRFVFASSSSTYGDSTASPKHEENIGRPLSPYAVTKYVNELYASVFGNLYGMETIGLRYFNVFGKNQDPNGDYAAVIPKFIRLLLRHQAPTIFGDGSQSRDFTYIDNVVQANELAATTSNPEAINTIFNVAYGESNSLLSLTNEIIALLARFDSDIASIKPIFGDIRKGDIKDSLAAIDKAKNLLGYAPLYDVHAGLQRTIKWYYDNLK